MGARVSAAAGNRSALSAAHTDRSLTLPDWFPRWQGETVVIVASGPSAQQQPLTLAKGKARFIAVNTSWKLCPWADVLYACDFMWWNKNGGCPEFKGLKLSTDRRAAQTEAWNIKHVAVNKHDDRLELTKPNTVGWGGNSGFHALNLAIRFGASKIILVGYDMTLKHGTHWHGDHPKGMNNPRPGNIGRWRKAMEKAAKTIAEHGVRVINCSSISELQNYPRMTFEEALL